MYLKSAWRALGKIYYHLLQIGDAKDFLLDDDEKEDEEAEFKARQLLKITGHLKQVAELYEYLGKKIIKTATLIKFENGYYGVSDSNVYYKKGNRIEYFDTRFNYYDISTVDFDGTDYYIVGYPLPIDGTTVRIRGYADD